VITSFKNFPFVCSIILLYKGKLVQTDGNSYQVIPEVDDIQFEDQAIQSSPQMLGLVSATTADDGYQYVASKNLKVFHKMACEHVLTIKKENLSYFHSLEEALASGRRGCKQCKPDE